MVRLHGDRICQSSMKHDGEDGLRRLKRRGNNMELTVAMILSALAFANLGLAVTAENRWIGAFSYAVFGLNIPVVIIYIIKALS